MIKKVVLISSTLSLFFSTTNSLNVAKLKGNYTTLVDTEFTTEKFKFVPPYITFENSMPGGYKTYYKKVSKSKKNVNKEKWHWKSFSGDTPKAFFDTVKELYEKNNPASALPDDTPRIPKIIHQIWLGSPLPEKYKSLQATWLKFHSDWQYRLWSDADVAELGNFPNKAIYDSATNWGEKSDILRIAILDKFGGLYADCDTECFEPYDFLHHAYDFYVCLEPLHPYRIGNAFIASTPGHPIMKEAIKFIKLFRTLRNKKNIWSVVFTTGPGMLTKAVWEGMNQEGFRDIVLPSSFLYPSHEHHAVGDDEKLNRIVAKPESFGVHYWELSWMS